MEKNTVTFLGVINNKENIRQALVPDRVRMAALHANENITPEETEQLLTLAGAIGNVDRILAMVPYELHGELYKLSRPGVNDDFGLALVTATTSPSAVLPILSRLTGDIYLEALTARVRGNTYCWTNIIKGENKISIILIGWNTIKTEYDLIEFRSASVLPVRLNNSNTAIIMSGETDKLKELLPEEMAVQHTPKKEDNFGTLIIQNTPEETHFFFETYEIKEDASIDKILEKGFFRTLNKHGLLRTQS